MMALMLVVLSIFSFGLKSNVKATGLTDDEIINIELNNIYVPNEVIYDFPLVTESAYNSNITWSSDNEEIIKIENGWAVVSRPEDKDETVTLTVTISRGSASNTKSFNITVKKGVTETNTYNINYVLNGGANNPNNPTSYKVGETTVLLDPTYGKLQFEGWYLNGQKITSLPKGLSGDITLTARWGEKQAEELVIKTAPNKTTYNALENFDSTGLVLTVKYNDGTSVDVAASNVTFDKTKLQGNDTKVTATYAGLSVQIEVVVNKLNIDLSGLKFEDYSKTYNGLEHKVELVGQLPEGVTEVKYTDNVLTNAGTLTAKAEFVYDEVNYNQPATLTATLEVKKAELTITVDDLTIKPGVTPTYSYTVKGFVNNENESVLKGTIQYLETNTDYTKPGTYLVGAKGLSADNYEITYVQGTLTITEEDYVIEAKDLTKVYNGENQIFSVIVKQGNTEVEGIEYTIKNLDGSEFKGATNVGTYKVVVSLVNEEAKDLEVTFEITKATYDLSNVEFKDVTATFDGSVHKVEVTGLPEGLTATYDKETTLVNAGSVTVTATFNNSNPNYNDVTTTLTATLTVNKAKLSSVTFEELQDVYFTGSAHEPTVSGKLGNYVLTSEDYDIAYEANTEIGTAKAILTAKGNFEGTVTLEFEILESDLSRVRRIKEQLEATYTELPTVFETDKEEASITWMSTSTALMINADGTYKSILTEKAQTVVVYAVVQYNNAVDYAKFEFVLPVKDTDTNIQIEGAGKVTVSATQLSETELANFQVSGESIKYGYDINLLLENQEVQPEGKVTVRIPIPAELKDNETLKVYHVNGTELEDMNAVVENGYLVFETDSFSYYLVTVEEVEVEEPTIEKITIAEFLAKEVSTEVYYELTGTIKGTYNTTYGNFYLVDASGEVLVYGLTATKVESNDKSFSTLGLNDGDVVTLIGTRADYNGTAQVSGPAYYVSHTTPEYNVSVEVEGNGQATLSADKALNGTTVTLIVTPDDGNALSSILVNNQALTIVEGQAEYEVVVSGQTTVKVTFVEKGSQPEVGESEVIDFTAQGYENNTGIEEVKGLATTLTFDKGTNSNGTKYYASGTAIRVYYDNEIKFTSTKLIVKVEFKFGSSDGSNGLIFSDGEYSNGVLTIAEGTKDFTLKIDVDGDGATKGNRRFVSVTIYYADGETPEPEEPTHKHDVCAECGKCTSEDCDGTMEKCLGHEEQPTHEHDVCAECGKCTSEDCDGTMEKCLGHEEQPSVGEEITATLTFDDKAKRTEFDTSHQIWVENGITLTNNKGKSTSNVADYAKPARFYKSSEIVVEVVGSIKEISFTCNNESYATALVNSVTGATADGKVVTITLDGTSSSYTISSLTGGQVRVDSVTVTYTSQSSSN